MDRYKLLITGGNPLRGATGVFGGKNTSVAVLPATLLADEPCVVETCLILKISTLCAICSCCWAPRSIMTPRRGA